MTKQQTVELLQKQLPGFYSVDQVIKMINDIEEDGQVQAYNENQLDDLVETIREKVGSRLRRLDSSDVIADEAADAAEKAVKEFFKTPQEAV